MPEDEKYAATFHLIDADGDGLVTAGEVRNLLEALGESISEETATAMVDLVDTDGDGQVSREELFAYLSRRPG
jgi:calmodulin